MEESIKTLLDNGIVSFTFQKVDGETRLALGTRMVLFSDDNFRESMGFTEKDLPKKIKKETPGVIPYWDIEKRAWRSVREDSIISIDDVIKSDQIVGGSLF